MGWPKGKRRKPVQTMRATASAQPAPVPLRRVAVLLDADVADFIGAIAAFEDRTHNDVIRAMIQKVRKPLVKM